MTLDIAIEEARRLDSQPDGQERRAYAEKLVRFFATEVALARDPAALARDLVRVISVP